MMPARRRTEIKEHKLRSENMTAGKKFENAPSETKVD
jgi:hypothetical protein